MISKKHPFLHSHPPVEPQSPTVATANPASAPKAPIDQESSCSYYSSSDESSETTPKVTTSPVVQDALFYQAKVLVTKAHASNVSLADFSRYKLSLTPLPAQASKMSPIPAPSVFFASQVAQKAASRQLPTTSLRSSMPKEHLPPPTNTTSMLPRPEVDWDSMSWCSATMNPGPQAAGRLIGAGCSSLCGLLQKTYRDSAW